MRVKKGIKEFIHGVLGLTVACVVCLFFASAAKAETVLVETTITLGGTSSLADFEIPVKVIELDSGEEEGTRYKNFKVASQGENPRGKERSIETDVRLTVDTYQYDSPDPDLPDELPIPEDYRPTLPTPLYGYIPSDSGGTAKIVPGVWSVDDDGNHLPGSSPLIFEEGQVPDDIALLNPTNDEALQNSDYSNFISGMMGTWAIELLAAGMDINSVLPVMYAIGNTVAQSILDDSMFDASFLGVDVGDGNSYLIDFNADYSVAVLKASDPLGIMSPETGEMMGWDEVDIAGYTTVSSNNNSSLIDALGSLSGANGSVTIEDGLLTGTYYDINTAGYKNISAVVDIGTYVNSTVNKISALDSAVKATVSTANTEYAAAGFGWDYTSSLTAVNSVYQTQKDYAYQSFESLKDTYMAGIIDTTEYVQACKVVHKQLDEAKTANYKAESAIMHPKN